MDLFKIVQDNKKSIREKSTPVELPLSEENKQILLNMLEYLKISQDEELAKKFKIRSGVGLAAPQIGLNKQMIAIYVKENNKEYAYALVNPKIISESAKLCYLDSGEGCLSVKKQHDGYIYRHYKINVHAYNLLKDKEEDIVFTGYLAIVAQHEIDHLSGILFYDRINKLNPFEVRPNAIKIG
ncbi:MAG: peptide deformylase [Candidatus Onthovivens sp.]|nr:peptide deformylase [Candidatus Onthovivens sp.]